MKILFFGMNRHGSRKALRTLIRRGLDVCGCVFEEPAPHELATVCTENSIPFFNYDQATDAIRTGTFVRFDYGVSYLYHKIITQEMIDFAQGRIINFHPAPVQVHKGVSACTYCLMHGCREWGSTAHFLTAGVDEGDIIRQTSYPVPDGDLTAIEFERIAQEDALRLFDEVAVMLANGVPLPRKAQEPGVGPYYSRRELTADKDIDLSMSSEEIDRKIRALWFPPYHGASLTIGGKRYSLVDDGMLRKLAKLYSGREA